MLQFNATVCTITGRFTPRLCWRFTALFATSSTQPLANEPVSVAKKMLGQRPIVMNKKQDAKFNELKLKVSESLNPESSVIPKIRSAGNVHELLDFIKLPYLSQNDILKVMGTIVNWIQENNGNMSPEYKPPFKDSKQSSSVQAPAKKASPFQKKEATATGARPVKNGIKFHEINFSEFCDLSTSTMIQEISKLRAKKDRNVRLLRYLYDNIIEYNHMLTLGECSSLVFNMCALNYPCKALLDKISLDIMKTVTNMHHSSLHSIIKSMAILRYKNESFLNYVSTLILKSENLIGQKRIVNSLQSLAILGYTSDITNMIIEKYVPLLTLNTVGADEWLNLVWSLALLKNLNSSVIATVLNNDFITDLMSADLEKNIPRQLKLLNINGFAKYIAQDYSGPFLDNSKVLPIVSPYTKEKGLYINALQETLKAIMPENSFKTGVNTNMGFAVDAECYMNANSQPVTTNNNSEQKNLKKIAIMLYDYHSYCLDSTECLGIVNFYTRLLQCSGYRICHISYRHFGIEDKPLKRIDVLKRRMQLVK